MKLADQFHPTISLLHIIVQPREKESEKNFLLGSLYLGNATSMSRLKEGNSAI